MGFNHVNAGQPRVRLFELTPCQLVFQSSLHLNYIFSNMVISCQLFCLSIIPGLQRLRPKSSHKTDETKTAPRTDSVLVYHISDNHRKEPLSVS